VGAFMGIHTPLASGWLDNLGSGGNGTTRAGGIPPIGHLYPWGAGLDWGPRKMRKTQKAKVT
jgi:hypothetical protein